MATGASIAHGAGTASTRITVCLGEAAGLDADPGPLIVCAGARVRLSLRIDLAPAATLRWRELVVLGRTGERPGSAVLDWDVRRDGRPLLRQTLTLDPDDAWPGLLAGNRVVLTELQVGPPAATVVHSPTAVTQRVAADVALTTVLAGDAASALRYL